MSTIPASSFHTTGSTSRAPEERSDAENRWVSFQPYLKSKGYQLRPRYQPDWIPSWTITGANPRDCEDSEDALPMRVLDAVRVNDQLQVMIKILVPSDDNREGEQELEILQHFSAPPLNDNPANHIIPCLDSFPIPDVPGGMFYVMPLLGKYNDPPFYNLAEIHDFLVQTFEGLDFLHEHEIAHCDIAPGNILMHKRPLLNEAFHPFHQHRSLDGKRILRPKYIRSQKPVQYYYIDFGYAKWFKNPTTPRTVSGTQAKERAPEQIEGAVYDPFKVDIFQLGALLRRDLIPKYESLDFLLSLARQMTSSDPQKRPTIRSAQHTMNTHFAGLSGWKTRWPILPTDASFHQRLMSIIAGLTTELMVILGKIFGLVSFQC